MNLAPEYPMPSQTSSPASTDVRFEALKQWVRQALAPLNDLEIRPLSGDASFRRYFRAFSADRTWVVMDAPPAKEDCKPFVAIAKQWRQCGVRVPEICAEDLEQGFLLLSDFGDDLLLGLLTADNVDGIYRLAIDHLLPIQNCPQPPNHPLPPYDRAMLAREMELFRDWLVGQKLGLTLSAEEHTLLDDTFDLLIQSALAQPQVCVHRDYHSRNLLLTPAGQIAVLDFQDAVVGPYSYDLVSLLRDCYIRWPQEQVRGWALYYYQKTAQQQTQAEFLRGFDLMGIQRHLKAAGIFARLSIRDGKHGYLNDVPRTVGYIESVSAQYPELQAFHQWLQARVLPAIATQLGTNN
jgi:N-acetylmuramate 1-kinase